MANIQRLDEAQIDAILDRLVPLIAAPEEAEFSRVVLRLVAEESSSGHFAQLVNDLLHPQQVTA